MLRCSPWQPAAPVVASLRPGSAYRDSACDPVQVIVTTQTGGGVVDLTEFSDWEFERVINTRSTATVELSDKCAGLIYKIDPVCHELRFVQDGRTLWMGPINKVRQNDGGDGYTLTATDRIFNLDRVAWANRLTYTGTPGEVVSKLLEYAERYRNPRLTILEADRSILTVQALGVPGTYVASSLQDLTGGAMWFTVVASDLYIGSQQDLVSTGRTYDSGDFLAGLDIEIDGTYMADQIVLLYNQGESVAVFPPLDGAVGEDACGGLLQVAISAGEIVTTTEALQVAQTAAERLSVPQVYLEGSELDLDVVDIDALIPGYTSGILHEESQILKTLQLGSATFAGIGKTMLTIDVGFVPPADNYTIITGS